VHCHALAFVGWLLLLTTQVLLIRVHRADLHRRLGVAAAGLALVMLVLEPTTAIVVDGLEFGTPGSDPAFLSVQLTDILAFAGLVAGALVRRRRAASHKRLMLLATIYIGDAGFARWLAGSLLARFGDGFWGTGIALYGAPDVLMLGLGLDDLGTRRRLHPAASSGLPGRSPTSAWPSGS
jgi:hypothetical protein